MSAETTSDDFISAVKAARLLGCPIKQVPSLAAKGLLTVRRLPGCDPRYLLSNVQRLARQCTQPANVPETE
jgi:hypothetical protein